jgi:type I restriction enzyme R subunit
MREFLDYVLRAYERHRVKALSLRSIRDFLHIRYGGTNDAKAVLGSLAEIRKAFINIQGHLFR